VSAFPRNRWWVAGFSWELSSAPLARCLLGHHLVLFRTGAGEVAALEDRCCHKELPLSMGTLRERDQILWIWIGDTRDAQPEDEPPAYPFHADPRYRFGGGSFHYDAPWQLIHDNLMDLSHLGYVHLKTIGGNPSVHMNASLTVTGDASHVKVLRLMPGSAPPPTYTAAWPFQGLIDRWQDVDFRVSHLLIWTGGMDVGSGSFDDPAREGFHMRGFHGVTPETETTAHYFWTIATNPQPGQQDITPLVVQQTAATFMEDKVVIEAQFNNQLRFPVPQQIDIHVDVGPNRARRILQKLCERQPA